MSDEEFERLLRDLHDETGNAELVFIAEARRARAEVETLRLQNSRLVDEKIAEVRGLLRGLSVP